jgi:hypothetical protein
MARLSEPCLAPSGQESRRSGHGEDAFADLCEIGGGLLGTGATDAEKSITVKQGATRTRPNAENAGPRSPNKCRASAFRAAFGARNLVDRELHHLVHDHGPAGVRTCRIINADRTIIRYR